MSNSQVKATMIVFFDIRGINMTEWIPERQTVNQWYYLQVLTKLQEQGGKGPYCGIRNGFWISTKCQLAIPHHKAIISQ
jgi:hypothetical protein